MNSKLYHLEQDGWQEQCQPTSGVTSFTVQWITGERSWIHPRSEDSHSPFPRTRTSANQKSYPSSPATPGMKSWLLLSRIREGKEAGTLGKPTDDYEPQRLQVLESSAPTLGALCNMTVRWLQQQGPLGLEKLKTLALHSPPPPPKQDRQNHSTSTGVCITFSCLS